MEPWLLLNANRNSYAIYRMVPILMTLSDPLPRFQGDDSIQHPVTRKRYKTELYLQWQTDKK